MLRTSSSIRREAIRSLHGALVVALWCLIFLLSVKALAQKSSSSVHLPSELVPRTAANPSLPTIFIVGDSTSDFRDDRNHEGVAGVQGWGVFFPAFFDATRVNVVNAARGGRSSRTYMTEGLWDAVLTQLKPKDIVLIQLGQNDVFAVNDDQRARGTIPGIGEETEEIDNLVTYKHEIVHTYGWYLRKYIRDAKMKGAQPIVLSLTTRNVWKDGHVEIGVSEYRRWARTVAFQEGNTDFVDVSAILAREYEKMGQAKVQGLYHADELVHMTTPGAYLAAQCTVSGLKSLLDAPVLRYLNNLGQMILPSDELSFLWPQNPQLPTLWIVGDSTVRNGDGTGVGGLWGWGDVIGASFDSNKVNVVNRAVSGRSSRTFYTMHWPYLLPNIKRGDILLLQFGHNDEGEPADKSRARATLPGVGDETVEIQNPMTGLSETVHTYGWYLRQMIRDAQSAGAGAIVCSPVPRKRWDGEKIHRSPYVEWAGETAKVENVLLLDINSRIATAYEALGKQKVEALFGDQLSHTNLDGARENARLLVEELRANPLPALNEKLLPSR